MGLSLAWEPPSCARLLSDFGSRKTPLLRWDVLHRAPFLEERLAPAGIAALGEREPGDAVGAEMAIALPELAPGGDHAGAIKEAERERPDRAPGLLGMPVAIADAELALLPDRVADGRQLRI